jgi:uncharacterized protein YqjF (DUF2071 family)
MNSERARPFLIAEWRLLTMLNYEVEPALLQRHVPSGTELDEWNGRVFLSVVGFLFQQTKLLNARVPFHTDFEEVNLRFYVRRKSAEGWRRGVTFLREIVPRAAIALVANRVYNERYIALPMRHRNELQANGTLQLEYSWRFRKQWHRLEAATEGGWREIAEGSEAEFITEHYWGYAAQRDGGCVEYQVEHPRWRVCEATRAALDCDIAALYGAEYSAALSSAPSSAFVAEGSEVKVHRGRRIEPLS